MTHWRHAAFIVALVSAISLVAILAARFDPLDEWRKWRSSDDDSSQSANTPTTAVLPVRPAPLGTDTSVSSRPQRLALRATRPGRSPREGHADLTTNGLSAQTYQAGAVLTNGARIVEIHADHIVLEQDGVMETLPLSTTGGPEASGPTLALLEDPQSAVRAQATSTDTLSRIMRLAPLYDDERVRAIEVNEGPEAETLSALGLQGGDEIVAINGRSIDGMSQAVTELREILRGSVVMATVRRGDVTSDIALDGAVLNSRLAMGP